MRINFLVPTLGITGGIKVIFEHANNLSKWGHDVVIIYPFVLNKDASIKELLTGKLKRLRRAFLNLFSSDIITWFKLSPEVKILRVPSLSNKFIPSAYATIATANETADWLVDYSEDKGKKFYFIQDYETWTRPISKVDATWKMSLKKIVIAKWLEKLAKDKFNENVRGIVPNGVDLSKYNNENKFFNKEKRVLMMYHILEKKGARDGLRAFETAKNKHPEISLTLYGAYKLKNKKFKKYPYYYQPDEDILINLFLRSDIFLWPSRFEGFGLPPMEAMASGCAVISTDTGAIRDFAIHEENVIIVPPEDPDIMAKYIIDLVENDNELMRISKNAVEQIKNFSFEKSTQTLEKILLE